MKKEDRNELLSILAEMEERVKSIVRPGSWYFPLLYLIDRAKKIVLEEVDEQ